MERSEARGYALALGGADGEQLVATPTWSASFAVGERIAGVATRHEGDDLPTLLTYGHGDVVRGLEDQWHEGLNPWVTKQDGDKLYGRGTADNKGQHTINMAAIR